MLTSKNNMNTNYAISRLVVTGDRPDVLYAVSPSAAYNYFYLESVSVPIIYDIIPASTITFVDGAAVAHTIPVAAGQWGIIEFTTYLTAQMDAAYPAGAPYVDTYAQGFHYTITATAGQFSLTANNPVLAQRAGIIGTVSSVAGVATFSRFNMGPTSLLIETNLPIDSQSVSYTNLTAPATDVLRNVRNGSTYTAVVAISSTDPTGLNQVQNGNLNAGSIGTHSRIKHDGINSLSIKMTDELGTLIDIYPQRWTLTFVFYNYFEPLL